MIRNFADHSANERTFLAWVRTAIAIAGFGIAISRLTSNKAQLAAELGLLGGCALIVLMAYGRMLWLRRHIDDDNPVNSGQSVADALLVALVVALLALMAFFVLHIGSAA